MFFLVDAALFGLGLLAFLCVGLGWGGPHRPILESVVLPGLAWLGAFGLGLWACGMAGLFTPRWVAGATIVYFALPLLAAPFAPHFRTNLARVRKSLQTLSRTEKALAGYLVAVSALSFALTLAPPTGSDYDSLVYHLAVPEQYLREGRILELRYDHHSYFPFLLEMWFSAGLALRGAVFAKLFHWAMLPVCAALLATIGARGGSRAGGFWAAALFVSLPVALGEASTAYVDLGFTAFTLAALACLMGARDENRIPGLAWCGVFCGMALQTKYFGALVFAFLGAWILIESIGTRRFRPVLAFAVPAILIAAPLYLRNQIWVSNPVYPFAFEIFGGRGWTAEMARDYTQSQTIYGFGKGPLDLLMLPWRLAMTPLSAGVFGGEVRGQPFWPFILGPSTGAQTGLFDVRGLFLQSFVGPTLLALGLPAMLRRGKGDLGLLAWFFGFLWLFWALSSQQVRYLFPALASLCVLAGWFYATSGKNKPIFRLLTGIFLAMWLAFAPALVAWNARGSWPVILGSENPQDFLRRTSASQVAFEWIQANTPPDAKFVVFGEPRCFGLGRRYFWGDIQHNTLLLDAPSHRMRSHTGGPGLSLLFALGDYGATHVLVNTTPGQNGGVFGPPAAFTAMVKRGHAREIFGARGYIVYELALTEQTSPTQP